MLTGDQELLLERELGRRSLLHFLKMAWPLVEPARRFGENWHHGALCEHLQACTDRQIRRLVINVPPGTTKSITTSVMWPAWSWIQNPGEKWITASYAEHIARRDALRARQLLESDWYRSRWGALWQPNPREWSSMRYRNTQAGFRMAVTVGGSITGEHGDVQLVDDPIKPLDARGARVDSSKLQLCREWWDGTMATRIADPETSVRVIIMQRLHEADLSAHALRSGGYVHLNLPMMAERRCVVTVPHKCTLPETDKGEPLPPTPLGYRDPRTEGELLWPDRFSLEALEVRKAELGSRGVAAQDQQRPTPAGGGIFKRHWIRYWQVQPRGSLLIQSWDCAFKGLSDSDFVVGQVWARSGGQFYLLDQVRDKLSFAATCKAIIGLSQKWPKARAKLIEDKANGSAVINHLEKNVPGLIAINPKGGKVARANAIEPYWEAGNVFLPHPELADWVGDFIEELVGFNGDPGKYDDQIDAMTQALAYLARKSVDRYIDAVRQGGNG